MEVFKISIIVLIINYYIKSSCFLIIYFRLFYVLESCHTISMEVPVLF